MGFVARDGCQALKEYVASMKTELPEPESSQWMSRMVRDPAVNNFCLDKIVTSFCEHINSKLKMIMGYFLVPIILFYNCL